MPRPIVGGDDNKLFERSVPDRLKKAALDTAYAAASEPVALARKPRKGFAAPSTATSATLAPGVFDQVDATAASAIRKLAAGVNADDEVTVKVFAVGAGFTVTIQGDTGVTVPTLAPLVAVGQAVTLSWTGSAWVVSGRDNPKPYLDATYATADPASTAMVYGDSVNPDLPTSITVDGVTTVLTYDASGNLLTKKRGTAATRTASYDTGGRLTGIA